jgi:hypothetical protein
VAAASCAGMAGSCGRHAGRVAHDGAPLGRLGLLVRRQTVVEHRMAEALRHVCTGASGACHGSQFGRFVRGRNARVVKNGEEDPDYLWIQLSTRDPLEFCPCLLASERLSVRSVTGHS